MDNISEFNSNSLKLVDFFFMNFKMLWLWSLYHFAVRCLATVSISEMPIAIKKAARRLIFLLLWLFPQNVNRFLSSMEAIKPSTFDHWGIWMFKCCLLPNFKVLRQPDSYWLRQDLASIQIKDSSIFIGFKYETTFQYDFHSIQRNHPDYFNTSLMPKYLPHFCHWWVDAPPEVPG